MSNENTPFNAERYPAVLDALGITYARDADGDIYADWEGVRMWFLAPGNNNEILAMRAIWDHRPPIDAYAKAESTVNDWNGARFWPRASTTVRDDFVVVAADMVIDLETGASDEFLTQQVRCMVSTTGLWVEFLAEAFPEVVG